MKVFEALQIVMDALDRQTSCGNLQEKVRQARTTIFLYVTKKLEEDKENEK